MEAKAALDTKSEIWDAMLERYKFWLVSLLAPSLILSCSGGAGEDQRSFSATKDRSSREIGGYSATAQERRWRKASTEQGGGGPGLLDTSCAVAVSCGQLIKAGFMFEGGKEVQDARTHKKNLAIADDKWGAKFEQLEKCELPASRAQPLS